MKKFITILAAAVVAFSCSSEFGIQIMNSGKQIDLTINASAPSTRTLVQFEEGQPNVYWSKSDVLGVWVNAIDKDPVKFVNRSADKEDASFSGTIAEFDGETASLFAICPQSLVKGINGDEGCVDVYILKNQHPDGIDSYDSDTDILLSEETLISKTDVASDIVTTMAFGRFTSLVKVAFTGEAAGVLTTEKIEKMSFSADGVVLAGIANIDMPGAYINNITSGSSCVNVYYDNDVTMATPQAFFTVAPCVIPAGTKLTFTVSTEAHHISKTVTAAADIDLTPGRYQPFNVSLSGAEITAWQKETLTNASLALGNDALNAIHNGNGSLGSGFQGRLRGQFNASTSNTISFYPEYDKDSLGVTIASYYPSLVSTDGSGYVKKVTIEWTGAKWAQAKAMYLYAKLDNYGSALDLFDEETKGDFIDSVYYYNGSNQAFKNPNSSISMGEWDLTSLDKNYGAFGLTINSPCFTPEIVVYWSDDGKAAQSLSFPQASYEMIYGEDFAEPELSGAQTTVTYFSSDEETAMVDPSTGTVTAVAAGVVTITARAASSSTLKSGKASYELTITDNRTVQALSFPLTAYSVALDETFTKPALSGAMTEVTYSSSNPAVATVNPATGAVNLVAEGLTTITATAAATEIYQRGRASYELTVNAPAPVVTKTTTLKGVWIKHEEDNLYDVTIRGSYETKNYVPGKSTQVQCFFKMQINNGTLTVSPVVRYEPASGEFEYVCKDLKYNDDLTYFAVARVGGSATSNVTGLKLSIIVGAEAWDTLAAWEPTADGEAPDKEVSPDSTYMTSVLHATTNTDATLTYVSSVIKPIKTNVKNGYGVYLPGFVLDDHCVFAVPVTGLKAGQNVRIVFKGVWHNDNKANQQYSIAWSEDGENYSTPVVEDVPNTTSSKQSKESKYTLVSDIDKGCLYVKVVMLSDGKDTKSLYFGNVYLESK